MFAQSSPPAEIAAWLACAAFVVMLYNQLAKARSTLLGDRERVHVSPQPLEVREVSGFARESDCRGRTELALRQLEELRVEARGDVGALHEKINGVAREVSEIAAAAGLHDQRLAQIDAKLDRMIERQAAARPIRP